MVFRGMLVLLSALACKGDKEQRSYCQALCEWAVGCAAADRDIDQAAEFEECLANTSASDPSCAAADEGSLNPVEAQALEPCVNAIDEAATNGECSVFTGTPAEVLSGTAPTECATQGADAVATFEAAQSSTVETNEEMCNRYAETFCQRAEECIIGDLGGDIPQAVIDAVGGTPFELCVQAMAPVFTNDCIAENLYAPEEGVTDINTARQAARTCMVQFSEVPCSDLTNPDALPEECAASQSSPEDLVNMAGVIFDLAQQYQDALP